MEFLNVIAAGAAAWIFGAIWYGVTAKPWMAAAGVTEEQARSVNPVVYGVSFLMTILVAGMMRHIFVTSNVADMTNAAISGFGLGAFIAVPWLATNYMFAGRPRILTVIDGTYAIVGCTLIGIVLQLF